jgi:hypothetical protein
VGVPLEAGAVSLVGEVTAVVNFFRGWVVVGPEELPLFDVCCAEPHGDKGKTGPRSANGCLDLVEIEVEVRRLDERCLVLRRRVGGG